MRSALLLSPLLFVIACATPPARDTLVMIIESSPANLDPRIGTDAQSERIGQLLFDALLHRDEHFNLQPWLAESWDIPDPKTYIFHLRGGVRFHDGRPLTSRDVKWTFDSMMDGSIVTAKASTYQQVERIDAPDARTVIFHLKEPFATLLWNVSDGAIGIVPYGSGADFGSHPVGSGPFRFVSAEQDANVLLDRNDQYWRTSPKIAHVRFAVVPDTTTRALELRRGSADVELNAITADMAVALRNDPSLVVATAPGSIYAYLALNLHDPILKDVRVRQAIACAIDRKALIRYLWRGMARPADSVLPPEHWAHNSDVPRFDYDPARARALLDAAGYPEVNGTRFHLVIKTSTEESSRLFAAVAQQELRQVGIALEIRSYEFATFYSDIVKGAFQMYPLRWIGGNEDPDIFDYAFDSASFPPKRANRGYYVNPRVDQLIAEGRSTTDQSRRKAIYAEVQSILAEDEPYIHLWYLDNVIVHTKRVTNIHLSPSGDYDFLVDAQLTP